MGFKNVVFSSTHLVIFIYNINVIKYNKMVESNLVGSTMNIKLPVIIHVELHLNGKKF